MDSMKLLTLLADDPRATITDLADILGESEADVHAAKRQLEKDKVICGYHTVINWDKTNYDHVDAYIGVSAKPERETGYDRLAERIARFPEVDTLYLLSGKAEFMMEVKARTMREVSNFVAHKLAPTEGVSGTETMFVLKEYKVNGVRLSDDKEDGERLLVTP